MVIKKRYVYIDAPHVARTRKLTNSSDGIAIQGNPDSVIEETRQKAKKILDDARRKADEIIKNAKTEAKKLEDDTNDKSGKILENSQKMAEKQIKETNERIKSINNSYKEQVDSCIEKVTDDLSPVLKEFIKKILLKNLDDGLTERKLKEVLTRFVGMKKIRIRINPEDIKLISEETLNCVKQNNFEFIPDSKINGGIIAETDLGIIDMSKDFQTREINDILDEVFANEKPL